MAQALVIARMPGPAMLLSDVIQLALGALCLLACLRALQRSSEPARYHWRWLAVSFGTFVAAQALGTYIDTSSNHSCDWADDILFSLSVIHTAMLLFLDPDHEHNRFDRLHVLDFVQVSCFWVSVYLYFASAPSIALVTAGWEGFGWSSSLVFNGVLTLSFLLRALLTQSKTVRRFFGGMAIFVLCTGLADSYASYARNNVQSGQWFDLIWSFLLGIPLTIALAHDPKESLGPQPAARAQSIIVNQFFPLLYPFFALLMLVQDARRAPALSSCIAMVVFSGVGVRVLIMQHRLLRAQETLEFDASHDALTRIWNRASILESLQKEVERHSRTGEPLTVMLADIDHFKVVNDTHGHMVGDQVLIEVARRLAASVRGYDSVGRYGGEEFLIVVTACDRSSAISAGERLRYSVSELPVPTSAGSIPVAISVGLVSTSNRLPPVNHSTLIRMADQALYRAKARGRNRVERADSNSQMKSRDSKVESLTDAGDSSVCMEDR